MATRVLADDDAHEQQPSVGRGLAEGLLPNGLIFAALYGVPWVDEHVYDWVAVGVLYAGPAVVGLVGLWLMVWQRSRRRGIGLVLGAATTVACWLTFFSIATSLFAGANTAGP
jgi:Na+/proline symporter